MNRISIGRAGRAMALAAVLTVPVHAGTVIVVDAFSGNLLEIDKTGQEQVFASGLGTPFPISGDQFGNLYAVDFDADDLLKIAADGTVTTFTTQLPAGGSYVDLAVAPGGKPYVLMNINSTSEVWRLVENGPPEFIATILNEAPVGQTARGFTFGPRNNLYLPTQGGNTAEGVRIIEVKLNGDVSTWFDPGFPNFNAPDGVNFTDMRFSCHDSVALILGRRRLDPYDPANDRVIFRLEDGVISEFTAAGDVLNGALQVALDGDDALFVAGGGFGGGQPDGFLQRVDPDGTVTTVASFPPSSGFRPISDLVLGEGRKTGLDLGPDSISFCPHAGAVGYDVVTGDLAALIAGSGDFGVATEDCLADDFSETTLSYDLTPGVGEVTWFLMRLITDDGEASYDSEGTSQADSRDVQIAGSGVACP